MNTTSGTRIPHGAAILICDGRKAIFASNTGTPDKIAIQVHVTLNAPDNPATREHGTDQPGRMTQPLGSRRSAVEMTDRHDREERIFLSGAADRFSDHARQQGVSSIVLVAPARALAVLREKLDHETQSTVVAEIDKDLTKHPVPEIEKLLMAL